MSTERWGTPRTGVVPGIKDPPVLGRRVFSRSREWSGRSDSNARPPEPHFHSRPVQGAEFVRTRGPLRPPCTAMFQPVSGMDGGTDRGFRSPLPTRAELPRAERGQAPPLGRPRSTSSRRRTGPCSRRRAAPGRWPPSAVARRARGTPCMSVGVVRLDADAQAPRRRPPQLVLAERPEPPGADGLLCPVLALRLPLLLGERGVGRVGRRIGPGRRQEAELAAPEADLVAAGPTLARRLG